MLRLPRFKYLRPKTAREAARMAADLGPRAMFVAGGTDLFPKLKRRQFDLDTLIALDFLDRGVRADDGAVMIGAGAKLADIAAHPLLAGELHGYAEAAALVSSPPLRNAGTIGGNLCVDTRCNYYDMTYEWRKAAGFCMKKDGDICLVAPSSPRCWAVSSSDTAPMAVALNGIVTLTGPDGDRELPVSALYRDDGMAYLAKRADEVVTGLRLPVEPDVRSTYVKLRRRGSIDFPIAGVAVALVLEDRTVTSIRIVMSGVGSHPVEAMAAEAFLVNQHLTAESIGEAALLAAKPAKPLDNVDLHYAWRKLMVRVLVQRSLERLLVCDER